MTDPSKSKFLSLALRHKPESASVTLDAGGWTPIDDLLSGAAAAGVRISRDELEAIVAGSDKRRFAIRDEMIRANQGHSVPVDLDLARADPPNVLYHGTVANSLDAILREGLTRMARHHVHLSTDVDTARRVGSRRGDPVILQVSAAEMAAGGTAFFLSENGVWLVDAVPPAFLLRIESF